MAATVNDTRLWSCITYEMQEGSDGRKWLFKFHKKLIRDLYRQKVPYLPQYSTHPQVNTAQRNLSSV